MIKFFRRIRRKLIDKGKLKSYLFYAVGEILLVMVGILLALQVNNWNHQRIDNKKELKALLDLNKEFKLNAERIKTKQDLRISIVPELENYVSLISSGNAEYRSFEEFHLIQFIFGMTNPSKGVIDALISSGEISLISNNSLKYSLADWKNQASNLYENEQILWGFGLQYVRVYNKTIPDPRQSWNDWDNERLETAFDELTLNIEYKNNLVGFEGANKVVIEECKATLNLLENVLILLDKEINKYK